MRQKENPKGGSMLLLLGAAGVALYGYFNGWFSSLTTAVMASPAPTPTTGTVNPVTNPATQIVNAPSTPPPIGTVVTNANDLAAQAAASYMYILPAQSIGNLLSLVPNGYTPIVTADYGTVYLRNDVFGVVSTDLQNRIARAVNAGAAATSIQQSTQLSLDQIKVDAQTAGLSGLSGLMGYRRGPRGLRGCDGLRGCY